MIPQYKTEYMSSVGLLYRQLQDVEIYVEDQDSEVFYCNLFTRLLQGVASIKKVIPLNGRKNVIDSAKSEPNDSPKVFIIDGDLFWSSQTFVNDNDRLYIHDFYCVENALFCANAAAKIVQESLGNVTFEQAKALLKWDEWVEEISPHLIRLFVLFSVSFKLKPSVKTTSRGFTSIITQPKNGLPKLDEAKVEQQYQEVLEALRLDYTDEQIESELADVLGFAEEHDLRIVSGKDFLVPLMCFKIKEVCGITLSVNSRNYRLSSHCDLDSLEPLKEFISRIIARYKPSH
ncbi:DUF4435 domain-containing protein [Vibrio sp. VPAP30]|uniref:DUF4435 domain-containing protein n=1 Tax=Vibrio sp. VPAP30 TaxID=1647102 RepID=UPI000659489C|nr:DUF4435 domain-containing protein [Vibrio sp. VPAP30]KLN64620.1 hypothetical protein ZX61_13505 [Vibrio sp. VPAP30]